MKRGLLDLTQNNVPLHRTVPHTCQRAQCQHLQYLLQNPIEMRLGGSYQIKEEYPVVGQLVLERQPPRVAFQNNDIDVVDDEEYKEPRERHPKVQYKLRLADNPAAQNMAHEEDYSDNNYESIDETAV